MAKCQYTFFLLLTVPNILLCFCEQQITENLILQKNDSEKNNSETCEETRV